MMLNSKLMEVLVLATKVLVLLLRTEVLVLVLDTQVLVLVLLLGIQVLVLVLVSLLTSLPHDLNLISAIRIFDI